MLKITANENKIILKWFRVYIQSKSTLDFPYELNSDEIIIEEKIKRYTSMTFLMDMNEIKVIKTWMDESIYPDHTLTMNVFGDEEVLVNKIEIFLIKDKSPRKRRISPSWAIANDSPESRKSLMTGAVILSAIGLVLIQTI